ncbi:hypothetical protein EVAR_54026_1 [Eumeta japonica]|uniref:Uncharacterized protein n=1 Tax=Eumeta variegata TaxID=151549 RepID=A0A4C1XU63_EUMVA|nr:hypothetical protein EVAR_54026_1 [Eumeta japonica]
MTPRRAPQYRAQQGSGFSTLEDFKKVKYYEDKCEELFRRDRSGAKLSGRRTASPCIAGAGYLRINASYESLNRGGRTSRGGFRRPVRSRPIFGENSECSNLNSILRTAPPPADA